MKKPEFYFYAVTLTSVYEIIVNEDNSLTASKVAVKEESRRDIGSILAAGTETKIAILQRGLQAYPAKYENLDDVPPTERKRLRNHTSTLVGLFLREDEAIKCHNENHIQTEIGFCCDIQWVQQTEDVLREIAHYPQFFTLSYRSVIRFSHQRASQMASI